MDFAEINEKLKDILAKDARKAIKDKDVALALGIEPNTYTQMKFRGSVPYKHVMDFLARRKISINLFFYGQERTNSAPYKTLRLFKASASLGGGALNDSEDYETLEVSARLVEWVGGGEIDVITGLGDSMEPQIGGGDLIFVRRGAEFRSGGLYALNTPHGVVVKECHAQGRELVLVSFNPAYVPVRFLADECQIIGAAVGIMRRFGAKSYKI